MITDSGVSDAPIEPVSLRVVVVAKDGSGNHTTIQSALDSSKPGDTIQVKNGVYTERVDFWRSGTRTQPITLKNFPGHTPVIDPGNGKYPANCCPSGGTPRVEFNAEWIILEGFEIRYGWDGVKVYKSHNTIRNNWIHHNRYQGILIVSASDVFVVGNTVELNGTDPGACHDSAWGGVSQKHCHGIYMSDFSCTGMSDITIRGNVFSNHGGRGIQWNGADCDTEMQNTLVENNLIENNSWGMAVYYNVRGSIITNNTFVLDSYPATDDSDHFIIGVWGSRENVFKNNVLYSTRGDVGALVTDSKSVQNTFDYNLWKVTSNQWYWKGSWRNDFRTNYKSLSGWDSNGQCCNVDPGFYNVSNGIYHLVANSPARDRGQNSSCAFIDIDNENRSDLACDIGMDEYNE